VLSAVRETPQNAGAAVSVATDGSSAARRDGHRARCDRADIGMHGSISCLPAVAHRESTSNVPILMLTGRDQTSARFWGLRAGADTCLFMR
jgi:DNA-binding response OmpR family regulator